MAATLTHSLTTEPATDPATDTTCAAAAAHQH